MGINSTGAAPEIPEQDPITLEVRTQEMTLDSYTPQKAAELGLLMHELDPVFSADPVPVSRLQRIIDSPDHIQIETTYGDALVGAETLSTIRKPGSKVLYLGAVVSDPKYRDQGLRTGARLMSGMLDAAEDRGLHTILLGTETDKPTNPLGFYEHFGAKVLVGTEAFTLSVADFVEVPTAASQDITGLALRDLETARALLPSLAPLVRQTNPELSDEQVLAEVRAIIESTTHAQLIAIDASGATVGFKNMSLVLEPGFDGQACMTDSTFPKGIAAEQALATEAALLNAAVTQAKAGGITDLEILAGQDAYGVKSLYERSGAQVMQTTVILQFDVANNTIRRFGR